jgi:16S rRNA (guanine966-N2)-methyltransferase
MLRIISGERRGHKIDGPNDPRRTRATSDLVRESIFNILGDTVVDREVIDLFAGTGAMGLEALSRGASYCRFIEKRRENAAVIARNIATLRFEGRAEVVLANAYTWPASHEFDPTRPVVVFVDPPYADYEDRAKKVLSLLSMLIERVPDDSLLVVEAGRKLDSKTLPGFQEWDVRRYGDTQVAVCQVNRGSETFEQDPVHQ